MSSPSSFPVALLAGGLATRLRPITEKIPKLLVDVAGEPFFTHQLRLLKAAGLRHVIVCAGYLGEKIVEQYGDGAAHGVRIEYSFDGPTLLGTGGALMRALPLLGETFFVLYGDSYLPIDYRACAEAFVASRQPALMTVYENRGQYDRSNVWYTDGAIRVYDKKNQLPEMQHIDYGLGVLSASALDCWSRAEPVDLAQIYNRLSLQGRLAGFEVRQRFYEVGSHEGLRELDALLRTRGKV